MKNPVKKAGWLFAIAAGIAALTGLTMRIAVAEPVTTQQMSAVHTHCTQFAARNKRINTTPEAFCRCFVNAVQNKFNPSGQKILFTAMAATMPNDNGEWHWMESKTFVRVARAQDYTSEQKKTFSKQLQSTMRNAMPHCAVAKDNAATAPAASHVGAMPHAARNATICTSKSCFSSHFTSCKPAVYTTAAAMGGKARYEIQDTDGTHCHVRMWYTANPNPAWVGKPLTMTLNPEHAFAPQMKAAMQVCLTQDEPGHYDCAGPLRGIAAPASK